MSEGGNTSDTNAKNNLVIIKHRREMSVGSAQMLLDWMVECRQPEKLEGLARVFVHFGGAHLIGDAKLKEALSHPASNPPTSPR